MSQPTQITALDLPIPDKEQLPDEFQKYFNKCEEKLGMVPNVLAAYSQNTAQLDVFARFYNELMFGESELTPLEKEMIAVVVSAQNHCYYCLTAHGAAVREYSGDPVLGELMVMNYRAADLKPRQRTMLDFADKLTNQPDQILESDRQALRDVGFSDQGIWDIANITGFYNMTNRVASAVEMQPNLQYHANHRGS
ncbi:peroxidase-related enzyme [Neptunomonas sp.]|uniref:peroxidase-related enzyme n=1 Tax=Neptunomonas sp. TaxID=1971898 RepID=UPI0025F3569D|nr:peroxidase-related enzyme [Neptunomonas sp.]